MQNWRSDLQGAQAVRAAGASAQPARSYRRCCACSVTGKAASAFTTFRYCCPYSKGVGQSLVRDLPSQRIVHTELYTPQEIDTQALWNALLAGCHARASADALQSNEENTQIPGMASVLLVCSRSSIPPQNADLSEDIYGPLIMLSCCCRGVFLPHAAEGSSADRTSQAASNPAAAPAKRRCTQHRRPGRGCRRE